ncbi:hypothetical protein GCM10007390_17200 [Persicitalea jodogahamensis]|uniref:Uncharacterized protein n=1 Tax=Persicitalea jodogahamensis TaxID=402147 RepID=A0A8J3D2U6_9BACT|nr:hypothetical protein GCM10007390_17200 [Persicitalea jodogahamensis]
MTDSIEDLTRIKEATAVLGSLVLWIILLAVIGWSIYEIRNAIPIDEHENPIPRPDPESPDRRAKRNAQSSDRRQ